MQIDNYWLRLRADRRAENQSKAMRIVRYAAIATVWLLLTTLAHATEPKDYAGTWVMRLDERNLFVLTLTFQDGSLHGTFERPAGFGSINHTFFIDTRNGVRDETLVESHFANHVLYLTFQRPDDPKYQETYIMWLRGTTAELTPGGPPPFRVAVPQTFELGPTGSKVAADWRPDRGYVFPDHSHSPNPEMKAIYKEDQRVREGSHINLSAIAPSDAERREQTRALVAANVLHTGEDYEEASTIFQHGSTAQDALLAHILAIAAISRGAAATWIAAATLDIYLQRIGQKQIFGTEYSPDPKTTYTQEPYDRELVSDALRQQLGVPSQALLAAQLKAYQNEPQH
jgi:hypothetical protein